MYFSFAPDVVANPVENLTKMNLIMTYESDYWLVFTYLNICIKYRLYAITAICLAYVYM